ncbi:MAG TPA: lipocalin-like domain-containing protein [Blastocatellia bacterium]|nr:lipocalin-like domain-containing protein [Blastocatellia bacterium]
MKNTTHKSHPKHLVIRYCTFLVAALLLTAFCLLPSAFCLMPSDKWREAEAGYHYVFPRDHGSHEDYGVEWWYYTGNVETKEGRRFGYQLTFFRVGVVREPQSASRWAVRNLYMAHFAVSDISQKKFRSFERINRAGIGWAGAESSSYRVWNEDWEAHLDGKDHLLAAGEDDCQIELRLAPAKPETVHGENGISQKGPSVGNASHYYSLTRLQTSGRIVAGGEEFEVSGLSWMDHEFGTSFLEEEEVGWDWFSIQLDDGRDLMMFQIRRRDGSIDPRSSGTLIDEDGRATRIAFGDFALSSGEVWRSNESGAAYPTVWTIEMPRFGLRLNVTAAFEDQELRTTDSTGVTYWEGSVKVEGEAGDENVSGRGYLEMTGYAGQNMGAMMR